MLFSRSFRRHRDALRRCPECGGRLACPISWEPADDEHWNIDLRCGDCDYRWSRVISNARAARFDIELDGDQAVLRRMLQRLDSERMTAEVETFATALARDLVEPADFAR
jgi:hypothetical protein